MKFIYVVIMVNPCGDSSVFASFNTFEELNDFINKTSMFSLDDDYPLFSNGYHFRIEQVKVFSSLSSAQQSIEINFIRGKLGYCDDEYLEDL